MDDRELSGELLPRLIELGAEPVDPNLVAAYVDDALPDAERRTLVPRIESDAEALFIARALEEDRRHARAVRTRIFALAASVVLAVGVWWTHSSGRDAPRPSIVTRMASATQVLKTRAPELFDGFEPLADGDLRRTNGTPRGGATWISPVGVLVEAPAELRWRNAAGSSTVRISLRGPGVDWEREVEGDRVAAPALAPGRYVVRLRALDALAGQEVRRGFEVADDSARAALQRAIASIRAHVDGDLASLLAAHYATRRGFHARARELVEAAASGEADVAAAARALRTHLDAIAPQR